jgi:hypothetical protein
MSDATDKIQRPDSQHVGLTTYDAKDPDTKFPPIESYLLSLSLTADAALLSVVLVGCGGPPP